MALNPGLNGADDVLAKASIDIKETNQVIHDATDSREVSEKSEPLTSRWELWAWYGYAFGNNSAGTLSYAPLSMTSE